MTILVENEKFWKNTTNSKQKNQKKKTKKFWKNSKKYKKLKTENKIILKKWKRKVIEKIKK